MAEESEKIIPKKARDLYARGEQALNSANYDYAITLFESALCISPEFSDCRRKLRLAEFRKFDLEKPQLRNIYLKLLLNPKPVIDGYYHFYKSQWLEAIKEFEKILKIFPKNITILSKLAIAAENSDMIDIAIDSLNAIRLIQPKDVTAVKEMARIYKDIGDINEARQCYETVSAIAPNDPDAGPELRKIAAIGTIRQTSWDRLDSFREKIRDEEQAKLFETELKLTKTDAEIRDIILTLEKKLELSPGNLSIIKNLAELYYQISDFAKSKELANKLIEDNPSDPGLKKFLTIIELKSVEREIVQLKDRFVENPENDGIRLQIKELEQKKRNLRLADCKSRVEQYPTNLILRYELGNIYIDNGMHDRAIPEFQLSVKTPSKKIQSLNCLGICFKQKKMFDLAVEQFTAASESIREMTP